MPAKAGIQNPIFSENIWIALKLHYVPRLRGNNKRSNMTDFLSIAYFTLGTDNQFRIGRSFKIDSRHILRYKFGDIHCLDFLFLTQIFHPVFNHRQAEGATYRYIRDL